MNMNDREEVFERRVRGLVLCLALGKSVGRSPADLTSIETVLAGWRRRWRRSPSPWTGVVGTTVSGQPAGYRQSHCWPRVVAPRPPRSAARIQREPDIVEPPATKHGISRPHPLATAGRHRPQQARLPHCAHMWCRCADGDPAVHVAPLSASTLQRTSWLASRSSRHQHRFASGDRTGLRLWQGNR